MWRILSTRIFIASVENLEFWCVDGFFRLSISDNFFRLSKSTTYVENFRLAISNMSVDFL